MLKSFSLVPGESEEIEDELKGKKLSAHTYQATDHLEALALWEFDMICAENIAIRRCELCGRYFLPHSVVSIYCDRPVEDRPGKTCKDIGAMLKHQKVVEKDEAKKLYRKVANRVHTAAVRLEPQYPHILRVNYCQWQFEAKALLERVESGEIDFDEFEGLIDKSPRELLGIGKK